MTPALDLANFELCTNTQQQYATITEQLYSQGYCVIEQALAADFAMALHGQAKASTSHYKKAEVGRGDNKHYNPAIRSDEILWITGQTAVEAKWLSWADGLRTQLNRRLFLNLSHFESHFSHYPVGAFYRKHRDAFQGNNSRLVSVVAYLNPNWREQHAGEMLIYDEQQQQTINVQPQLGTVAVFLSNDFPHEVLATQHDRYSIASWFSANDPCSPVISRLR